jgi:phosphohistidine phosphatase
MPFHLYLLRHAQSAEKQIGQPDKERDLTSRGLKDSLIIGDYLKKHFFQVDQIVSSTAIRALETSRLIIDGLKINPDKITEEDELYEASTRTFLEVINNFDDGFQNILCIGHNPVISYLAEYITKSEIGSMETAGLAIIKLNIKSWKEVSQGNGELITYIYPELLSVQ